MRDVVADAPQVLELSDHAEATLAPLDANDASPRSSECRVYRQKYAVVPTVPQHLRQLATMLRDEDVAEIAGTGNVPKRALWRGYRNSILCETAIIEGEPAAIWGLCIGGIVGVSPLNPLGRPWLLTSARVEAVPFAVVREAKHAVSRMLSVTPMLENYVLSSYTRAVRMLRMIGFTVDDPVNCGKMGIPYSRFHVAR